MNDTIHVIPDELFNQLSKAGPDFDCSLESGIYSEDLYPLHKRIEQTLRSYSTDQWSQNNNYNYYDIHIELLESADQPINLKKLNNEERVGLLLAATERFLRFSQVQIVLRNTSKCPVDYYQHYALRHGFLAMTEKLLAKKSDYTHSDIHRLLSWFADAYDAVDELPSGLHGVWQLPIARIISATEKTIAALGPSSTFDKPLDEFLKRAESAPWFKKHIPRIQRLRAGDSKLCIEPGEAWSDNAIEYVDGLSEMQQACWKSLFDHCITAESAKPNGKWVKAAEHLIDAIVKTSQVDGLVVPINAWFEFVGSPPTITKKDEKETAKTDAFISETNTQALKGLVWVCGIYQQPQSAVSIGSMCERCYRKRPGYSSFNEKIANASVWALGELPDDSAFSALSKLKIKVKAVNHQKIITKALLVVAERKGLTPQQLEEMSVPDYGFTKVGELREDVGNHVALLSISSSRKTNLVWETNDGKQLKTVPKNVKDNFADELKTIRQSGKDAVAMLTGVRHRLESYLRQGPTWELEFWLQHYWNHPINGVLVRSLIWNLGWLDGTKKIAACLNGELVDLTGVEISERDDITTIELWHPINSTEAEISSWRKWLLDTETVQPFKQAHREIYRLTDAEKNTGNYSNRFASHILKQRQFKLLNRDRGWKFNMHQEGIRHNRPASILLEEADIRAEYWVKGTGGEVSYDPVDEGTYLYISTDQVRFYHSNAAPNTISSTERQQVYESFGEDIDVNHPLKLDTIAPVVFSELMRDVDLFVGVSSICNDPSWSDTGQADQFNEYWGAFSFGKLSELGRNRKAVLEALIPRLKISGVCSIEGRFLRVKGKKRTYKIHLGSSNILMEPNDEYLCIVPKQVKSASVNKVFLPFEGDTRLTTILSKAFLLAADDKITDPTILSQI